MSTDPVRAGRITVELSHTGKVLFPDAGITKGDLVAYYQHTAGAMLPWLRGRPVAMRRFPDGITTAGIMNDPWAGLGRRAAGLARAQQRLRRLAA
jgi:hypothetical protein